ncbi:MAG: hypothetical protein ACTSYL_11795 [Candidatus Thorarchaeota archaeon]
MGLTKLAATHGLIPCGNKLKEVSNNLYRLMTTMAEVLEERYGEDGLAVVSDIFRRLGAEDATALKARLGLGDTIDDATDAWIVIGNVMGAKMRVRRQSPSRVETDHPYCPQHESFVKHGKLYCDSVCLPYVSALAKGIAPTVDTEVIRPADMKHTCTKALVVRENE